MKTISEHILDLIQNSIRAKANLIEIIVEENKIEDFYTVIIKDNGCGMSDEILSKVSSPFYTSRKTRKVGLGLSILKQNAEGANGFFNVDSKIGLGTKVKAQFQLSHFDRPPFGEIWDIYYLMVLANENIEIRYSHTTGKGTFEINSLDIRKLFEGVSLQNKEVKDGILAFIKNNLKEINTTN